MESLESNGEANVSVAIALVQEPRWWLIVSVK